jgi:hypothetical protein
MTEASSRANGHPAGGNNQGNSGDPTMPNLMPPEVGKAISTLLAFRSVEPIEIYRAVREALSR